jgi:hypothetical protein
MATVTSLTASRMLEIEAASIIDGDVVGDNLVLTRHDGTQINAGSVRGPQGTAGLPSADLPVIAAQSVLDIGLLGQIRAGRQLAATDFTNMGLPAPLGLWNLTDLTDASGNGRNLLTKGAVSAGQVSGINGVAGTAAKFAGTVGQALYIPDDVTGTLAGANFRIKTGSFGCWFRTSKKATPQILIGKWSTTPANTCWILYIADTNKLHLDYSLSVTPGGIGGPDALTNVCDDRWHFGVCTFDGTLIKLYTDGLLEVASPAAGHFNQGIASLNIGIGSADAASNGATPNFGRIDEAFVTGEVLTDDQVRNLYCAKIAHTLGSVPSRVSMNVRRRRRGATLVVGDFTAQPLRLHNFTLGVMTDEGAHGIALNNSGGVETAGVDGTPRSAYSFFGNNQVLLCNDTNLPAGLAKRSYGCWFKTTMTGPGGLVGWGANQGDTRLVVEAAPSGLTGWNPGGAVGGGFVSDGLWHHVVVVEDDTATDGKAKLYLDGRMMDSTNSYAASALAGVNRFCVGRKPDSTASFAGQIDSVFVCGYAMAAEEIFRLYNKSSPTQILAPSPKTVGDHVEALSSTDILATFDALESNAQVDLGVAA